MKTDYMLCLPYLISFCFFFESVSSITCSSNSCDLPEVKARCGQHPKECPKGFALNGSGPCECCPKCKKIIYENDDCTPESLIAGSISDKVVCAEGLQCSAFKCQKIP